MSDSNMLTAYSLAAGLFNNNWLHNQWMLKKDQKLINEINEPNFKWNNILVADKMLIDLDNDGKYLCLDDIAQISIHYYY